MRSVDLAPGMVWEGEGKMHLQLQELGEIWGRHRGSAVPKVCLTSQPPPANPALSSSRELKRQGREPQDVRIRGGGCPAFHWRLSPRSCAAWSLCEELHPTLLHRGRQLCTPFTHTHTQSSHSRALCCLLSHCSASETESKGTAVPGHSMHSWTGSRFPHSFGLKGGSHIL